MTGPAHEFLSAPLWILTALHVLTLTLHLAAMSCLLGALLVACFGRFGDRWANPTVRRLAGHFPSAMAATVSLGVAPLLFLQLVYPRQVYAAAIASGWLWLGIPAAVIVAYYSFYTVAFGKPASGSLRRPALLFLGVAAMVFVSVVYSATFSMAETPEVVARVHAADPRGLSLNPELGAWLPRWVHALAGVLALGGFSVTLLGRGDADAERVGRQAFVGGMVAAALAGVAYLLTLGDAITPLMRSPAILVLTLAIVLAAASAWLLLVQRPAAAGAALFVSLLGMVFVRHELRLIVLGDAVDIAAIPVRPQWDVFGIFLVCLLLGAGVIGWMIRLQLRASRRVV